MCSMAVVALWEGEQDDGLVLVRRWRISATIRLFTRIHRMYQVSRVTYLS
eukprot:COSAG01_NODE_225_length_21277_cov_71.340023_1_plen_50_part_00